MRETKGMWEVEQKGDEEEFEGGIEGGEGGWNGVCVERKRNKGK